MLWLLPNDHRMEVSIPFDKTQQVSAPRFDRVFPACIDHTTNDVRDISPLRPENGTQ